MKAENRKNWLKNSERYHYAVAVLAFGVLLMLLPRCAGEKMALGAERESGETTEAASVQDVVSAEERRLCGALRQIEGIGEVEVLLSLQSSPAVSDADSTLLSKHTAAEKSACGPEYRGAVIICGSGDRPEIALAVISAVEAYTGLGSDKITVIKGGKE